MKSFFCLLIILTLNASVYAQWVRQQSGTENHLNSVCFISESTGFVVGDNVILKTSNGGTNWLKTDISGLWNSVSFTNSTTGFICGNNGKILKTTNAGGNWFNLNSGTTKNLTSINFINGLTGFVTGWFKTLLSTTNGGVSFTSNISDGYCMLLRTFAINNLIFAIGTEGIYYKSTNFGASFDSLYIGMPNSLFGIQFFSSGKGFMFGCCGAFFKTSDFGENWNMDTVYLTKGWALNECSFINENTGWSTGEQGNIVRTYNSGDNWDSLYSGVDNTLKSVKFINASTGWTVGSDGIILKTINGGGQGVPIGVNNNSVSIPENFILYQNYPNPFNPSTKIKFDLKKSEFVTIKVFNSLGKEIKKLTNKFYSAGSYELEFSADDLSGGVYYLNFIAGGLNTTRKMILVK